MTKPRQPKSGSKSKRRCPAKRPTRKGRRKAAPDAPRPPKLSEAPDFSRDWRENLRALMARSGVPGAQDRAKIKDEMVDIVFFRLVRRLIEPRPRNVLVSSQLVVPAQHQTGFDLLRRKIERGDDLRAHQSRSVLNPNSNDMMLNDWGVQHLHLGTTLDSKGMIKGTKEVLYAWFERDTAYLITIRPHGRGHGHVWAERNILEVVRKEWPSLLRPVEHLTPGPLDTSRRRMTLRRKGGMSPTTLSDGRAYLAGAGYMVDGGNALAVRDADLWRACIRGLERHVTENFESLCRQTVEAGLTLPDSVTLHLQMFEGRLGVLLLEADVWWNFESWEP